MVTNCRITKRGRELCRGLSSYLGTTQALLETCSQIARHARTHHRLQEIQCNREITAAELLTEKHIEKRIRELVASLPRTEHGSIAVRFDGDPRGYTVKLIIPNQPHAGNTWGLGGEYGV